jgi:hypothetical protein
MLNDFNEDILLKIFKLFHKFHYLKNLYYVNKYCYKLTKYMYIFHISKFNNFFNINNNRNYLYLYISKKIYFNKILNFKKINTYFSKSISFDIPNFINYLLLFDDYFDNLSYNNNITFIDKKQLLNELVDDNTIFITFIVIYIKTGFSIHVQFNKNNNYRLKLKNPNITLCLYQPITKKNIINLLAKKNINIFDHFTF